MVAGVNPTRFNIIRILRHHGRKEVKGGAGRRAFERNSGYGSIVGVEKTPEQNK